MEPKTEGSSQEVSSTEVNSPIDPQSSVPKRRKGGPKTPAGRARSAANSITYGLTGKAVLLPGESRSELDSLMEQLREDLEPEGVLEDFLVQKLGFLIWRFFRWQRAESHELQCHLKLAKKERQIYRESVLDKATVPLDLLAPSKYTIDSLRQPFSNRLSLDILLRYWTSIDHGIDRTLLQLQEAQCIRKARTERSPIDITPEDDQGDPSKSD
jgi:hypothetical protein